MVSRRLSIGRCWNWQSSLASRLTGDLCEYLVLFRRIKTLVDRGIDPVGFQAEAHQPAISHGTGQQFTPRPFEYGKIWYPALVWMFDKQPQQQRMEKLLFKSMGVL